MESMYLLYYLSSVPTTRRYTHATTSSTGFPRQLKFDQSASYTPADVFHVENWTPELLKRRHLKPAIFGFF